jgi:transposase
MIGAPAGVLIWLVAGVTDLRKGLDSLAALVQNQLSGNPFSGDVYIFRGRRGDKVKLLWYSGDGVCLFYKRLSDGKFIWPQVQNGTVPLSPAQLAMLLEGIEWRRPKRTGKGPQDPDRTHPTQT